MFIKFRYIMIVSITIVVAALTLSALVTSATANPVRVSVATDGTEGNDQSHTGRLSDNNRYITFSSHASNLVTDTNGVVDIFVHDLLTGATIRVSVASDGTEAEGKFYGSRQYGSGHSAISADGRYVTFMSYASNLVAGDTNSTGVWNGRDVFRHDCLTGETIRVSVDSNSNQSNAGSDSDDPHISADGRYIVFNSSANNLVPGDINSNWDIFLHDVQEDTTRRVSVASNGMEAHGNSFYPSISADGRFVSFQSEAWDLVANDTNNKRDVFVHDRDADEDGIFDESGAVSTVRVSVASDGSEGNAESSITGEGTTAVSNDGRLVTFYSYASNLVENDTNNVMDVFVHDRDADEDGIFDESGSVSTVRVSVSSDGFQGNGDSNYPTMSSDGRYVAYSSHASNLVSNDTNNILDVFVHDLQMGETTRVSKAYDGNEGNGGSAYPYISADGLYVAYSSRASNLVSNDTNNVYDVFVYVANQTPDDLIIDFGASHGIWVRYDDGIWDMLHGLNAKIITVGDVDGNEYDDLIIDFFVPNNTSLNGIWVKYDNGTWEHINGLNAEAIVVGDVDGNGRNNVVIDFGTSYGIWARYDDGTWKILHSLDPEIITAGDVDGNEYDDLIIDFFVPNNTSLNGIWVKYDNGTWEHINGLNAEAIVVGDVDGNGRNNVVIDFGTSYGIWARYDDGTWKILHSLDPEIITAGDVDGNGYDDLIIDFGSSVGIWVRYDNRTWEHIHGLNTGAIAVGDIDGNGIDDLIIDFKVPNNTSLNGIWVKYDNGTWEHIHGMNCEIISVGEMD